MTEVNNRATNTNSVEAHQLFGTLFLPMEIGKLPIIMKDPKLLEIEKVFREADLQKLIKIGAPSDEYNGEALFLYNTITTEDSLYQIQGKIWFCFFNSFCTGTDSSGNKWKLSFEKTIETVGTIDSYLEIAEKIKKIIGGGKNN